MHRRRWVDIFRELCHAIESRSVATGKEALEPLTTLPSQRNRLEQSRYSLASHGDLARAVVDIGKEITYAVVNFWATSMCGA